MHIQCPGVCCPRATTPSIGTRGAGPGLQEELDQLLSCIGGHAAYEDLVQGVGIVPGQASCVDLGVVDRVVPGEVLTALTVSAAAAACCSFGSRPIRRAGSTFSSPVSTLSCSSGSAPGARAAGTPRPVSCRGAWPPVPGSRERRRVPGWPWLIEWRDVDAVDVRDEGPFEHVRSAGGQAVVDVDPQLGQPGDSCCCETPGAVDHHVLAAPSVSAWSGCAERKAARRTTARGWI